MPVTPTRLPLALSTLGLLGLVLAACGDVDDTSPEPVATPECPCDSLIDKVGELGKDVDGDGVITPGDTVLWTVSVSYNGSEACSPEGQVCFEDTLPSGLSLLGSTSADFTCSSDAADPETVTCCSGSLPADQDFLGSVTLTTLVGAETTPGEVENCATLLSGSDKYLPNQEADNDTDCATVVVEEAPAVDLELVKLPGTDFVAGQQAAWDFYVSNNGPGDATGVTLTDTLPAGMSFAGSSDPDWSCTGDGLSPETVTCIYAGTLVAGASANTSWSVDLHSDIEELVENCADLSADQDELDPENNASCTQVEVEVGCKEEVEVDLSTGTDDTDGSLIPITGTDDTWMYLGGDTSSYYSYPVPMWAIAHDTLGNYASPMGTSRWVSSDAAWSSTWSIYYPGGYDFTELTWEACFCVGEDAEDIGLSMEVRADDEVVGLSLNGVSLHSSSAGTYDGAHDASYPAVTVDKVFEVDDKTVFTGTNCLQVTSRNASSLFSLDVSGAAAVGCGCEDADLGLAVSASAPTKSRQLTLSHKIDNAGSTDEGRYVVSSTPPADLAFDAAATMTASPDWSCSWDEATATCLWTGEALAPGAVDAGLQMVFAPEVDTTIEAELCAEVRSRSEDTNPANDLACASISL